MIIFFLLKTLYFLKSLKFVIAYIENIIEKQFNANGPRIIRIGKAININLKTKLIFSFNKDNII